MASCLFNLCSVCCIKEADPVMQEKIPRMFGSEAVKEIMELKAYLSAHEAENKLNTQNIATLINRVLDLEWKMTTLNFVRTPHKCPLCDGLGCDAAAYKLADPCKSCCPACKGKGVLWG